MNLRLYKLWMANETHLQCLGYVYVGRYSSRPRTAGATLQKCALFLEFPDGTYHDYEVRSLKLLERSIEDLEKQKLAVLLPFYTLKLRGRVKKAKTSEERQALAGEMQALLEELVEAIMRGEQMGIITEPDKRILLQHVAKLVEQVYKQEYEEFEEVDSMLQGAILTYSEEAAIKAKEEGRQEGEQIGVVKGRQEGEQIGVVKGREEGREEVAKELLSEGMDVRMVARVAKLPEDTVVRLKAELEK